MRGATTARLAAAGCVAPDREADALVEAAGGDADRLELLVQRRELGEPLPWLTGHAEFCGLRIALVPGVYVPREQSEPLARRAAELLPPDGVGVDLCTGSGALAAVMAAAWPGARVLGTDLSAEAVACARANGVDAFEGRLDEPLAVELLGRVDVLCAVVPYVPTEAIAFLPRDVQAFEPALALDGGPEGLDLLADAARAGARWLRRGGWLGLELGGEQAVALDGLLAQLGFTDVETILDDDGDPRAVWARLA